MNDETRKKEVDTNEQTDKPTLLQIVGSILAAGFGVQSSKNRERDFKQGKYITYIIGGVIFTVLFVATVAMVVSTVLENAGM